MFWSLEKWECCEQLRPWLHNGRSHSDTMWWSSAEVHRTNTIQGILLHQPCLQQEIISHLTLTQTLPHTLSTTHTFRHTHTHTHTHRQREIYTHWHTPTHTHTHSHSHSHRDTHLQHRQHRQPTLIHTDTLSRENFAPLLFSCTLYFLNVKPYFTRIR